MTRRSFAPIAVVIMVVAFAYHGMTPAATDTGAEIRIPLETAANYVHAVLKADRAIYTTHVVERMQLKGIVVASENWEQRNTLPLPAQFLLESAKLVEQERAGIRYRLISLWPINERNGPASEVERTGLHAVLKQSDRPHTGVVASERQRVFQAVYADRAISQTCIGCHNTHPKSPKRDFKLNDVMGAIVITIPLAP
jgi:hypothetical protein